MKTVYIIRDTVGYNESLGTLVVIDHGKVLHTSHLLERGWRNNEQNVSCVPEGKYDLKLEFSPKFNRKLWEAYGVPNRTECKFHSANFWNELNGCFSPGLKRQDIGGDSELDMVGSRDALNHFMESMGQDTEARLVVINDQN